MPDAQDRLPQTQRAGPDFHPLQVLQDGDRPADLFRHPADDPDVLGVVVVRAVGKIQARHVHPGLDHLQDRILVVRSRTDRGDDPGADI